MIWKQTLTQADYTKIAMVSFTNQSVISIFSDSFSPETMRPLAERHGAIDIQTSCGAHGILCVKNKNPLMLEIQVMSGKLGDGLRFIMVYPIFMHTLFGPLLKCEQYHGSSAQLYEGTLVLPIPHE